MRLPRHDTPLRLSAEPPDEAIAADEALLTTGGRHWWLAASPAVVVGLGLRHRVASIVDLERCRRAGRPCLGSPSHDVLWGALAARNNGGRRASKACRPGADPPARRRSVPVRHPPA